MPVTRADDQPRTIPYKPVVPLSELLTHALSKKLVTKVVEHVPFIVGDFLSGELPPTLRIAGKWVHKAFKRDTYYSFVVVAFTKSKVCRSYMYMYMHMYMYNVDIYFVVQGSTELHTMSEPADPPVLIGK